MKKTYILLFLVCINYLRVNAQNDSITISGFVTDFNGNLIDSAYVEVKHSDFSTAYDTYTNENGEYNLRVKKGKYVALASIKMSEYPIAKSKLPKDKQRLEFWAWNIIANRDLNVNIKYNRLEVYGVNAFIVAGASPGYTIYCRPMSLTRYFSFSKSELNHADLAPNPKDTEIKIKINGEQVGINHIQKVEEYFPDGMSYGYLINVNFPKNKTDLPYNVFHITITDLQNNDKGEALYFKEKSEYK